MAQSPGPSILFFGDEISHAYPMLQALQLRKSDSALVSCFLEKSYDVFREELLNQGAMVRWKVPKFSSIFDLIERLQRQTSCPQGLHGVLVCVAQIGGLISYFEDQPDEYLSLKNTYLMGHGLGLLSAAAVEGCRSLENLASTASEVVRIALRAALHVDSVSKCLETASDHAIWSATVMSATETEVKHELLEFYKSYETPILSKVYLSGVANGAITISGPPFNLKKVLTECTYFIERTTIPSKLQGLYHNPHLYEPCAIYDIVYPSFLLIPPSEQSNGRLFSASGEVIVEPNRHDTLKRVVYEILTTPFNWNAIMEAFTEHEAVPRKQICQILTFGTTQATSFVAAAIQEKLELEVQLQDLVTWKLEGNSQDGKQKRLSTGKIAIIGMAARVPGANDLEEMWQVLEKGQDMHRNIPPDRFDLNTHVDPLGKRKNTGYTPYGCFIENPGFFDARFFGMSPKEAAQTDPMHRLALVTAHEALEMAGFVPNRTPSTRLSRIGTFYGQTSDDWREVNAAQNIGIYLIPGGVRAFAPGRINYFFKFSGPSYSIDTACSSSLAAIQVACTSLLQHECDMAVSGGLNVLTNPDIFSGLSRGGFLSKTGSCKVFDETADGYCRADAVGTVVLKRLEDAKADNDHILGVVLGTATNHSADAISITHPHAESQAHLYQSVLNAAGVDALDVSVVEMHGTGTQAGDLNEMRSVTQVFAPESRPRQDPLFLGSVKANLGHSEAAAGVTGLVKLLMMLQRKSIPPHVGIKTVLNPKLPQDLSARNVYIPQNTMEWDSKGNRLAFLNNFSAAGGNTALLLEEMQSELNLSSVDPRSYHIIAISAKSISALERNANRLTSYVKDIVKKNSGQNLLPSLSYTTCARRIHHNYRVAVVLSDIRDIENKLSAGIGGNSGPLPIKPPKIVFIFTGQGGFYTHVGKSLFESSLIFKNALLKMNEISRKQASITFLPLITGCEYGMDICDSDDPVTTQIAQLCLQMALAELWRSWGVFPDAVLGHSLGEYTALYVSGVLSMSDAIHLVAQRAKLFQSRCTARTHGMLAVQATEPSVEAVSSNIPHEVACRNSEGAVVLSALIEDIQRLKIALIAAGLKSVELDVPYAFHSSQVNPILDSFYEVASGINIRSPNIPVISPLLGQVVRVPGVITPAYLRRHLRETVDFGAALRSAEDQGVIDANSAFLELGPHPICCAMVKSTLLGSSPLYSLHKKEDVWLSMSKSVASLHSAGLKINWTEFHRDFEASHKLLDLPRYSFDEKNYWIDYTGDWCLTKGEPNLSQSLQTPQVTSENISPRQRKSKLPSSTVHYVVEEHIDADTIRVKFQSDISEPLFNSAITGHMVNGVALCPSSIYADMAFTIGRYLSTHLCPSSPDLGMDVCHMEVCKPLIINKNGTSPQILQVSVIARKETLRAELSYASVDFRGKEIDQHAKCVVEYKDTIDWQSDWATIQFLVQERIDALKIAEGKGMISKVTKWLAYKLFATFVQYEPKYCGMDVVILDSEKLEATASVTFQTNEGSYFCSPYWIDSLAHLSGFILNCSDTTDSRKFVFISHGWKSMRFGQQFSYQKTYQTYVRMQPKPRDVYEGTVYIFDSATNIIVGVVGGLKFQRIPSKLLSHVLSTSSPKASQGLVAPTQLMQRATSIPTAQEKIVQSSLQEQAVPVCPASPLLESSSLVSHVFEVIAENLDVDPFDFHDENFFIDLGMDSIMSMAIGSQLRESLDLDIPATLFLDHPTVKSLRAFLTHIDTKTPPSEIDTPQSSVVSSVTSRARTTPSSVGDLDEDTASGDIHEMDTDNLILTIRTTISEQMGIPMAEIMNDTDLSSLGMDSLMSLSILGDLREETGLDFPSDFFIENQSMGSIKIWRQRENKTYRNEGLRLPNVIPIWEKPKTIDQELYPPARSFLLQGRQNTAKRTLFLFPDGSGSASSYTKLPPISPDLAVYAFNCPFMTTPEQFTVGIPGVATLYLAEVRRRQPVGPYLLGGWSAGGVIAYEVMQQLLVSGESVEKLILLDSPCPLDIVRLPPRLHHFFSDIGLLGDLAEAPTSAGQKKKSIPDWLLPHFQYCIDALVAYKPQPISVDNNTKAPKVIAIWARYGVCRFLEDPRPDFPIDEPPHLKWLLENRTEFGPNGWDILIPGSGRIRTEVLDGNHFTIMKDKIVNQLGSVIGRAIKW